VDAQLWVGHSRPWTGLSRSSPLSHKEKLAEPAAGLIVMAPTSGAGCEGAGAGGVGVAVGVLLPPVEDSAVHIPDDVLEGVDHVTPIQGRGFDEV